MKRAIIVHRWEGTSSDDWRSWLKSELEKLGYEVLVPDMPDTETPVIEAWVSHLRKVVGKTTAETFFVGHSIGCQAILRFLETVDTPVGGAVFVAGWFNLENLEDEEVEQIARPWLTTFIDLEKIRRVLPKSTLLVSDNDPFGALEENKEKFAELGSEIVVVSGAGHFTSEDGYATIPDVVSEMRKLAA